MMTRIITLMLTLIAALHANAQITIDQRIDTMQILIGEQTNLTISATIKHGQKIAFPSFKRSQYITPGLEVLENLESDTTKLDDDKIRVSKSYVLTSFDENLYYIPSLKIKVDGKNYPTKALALKVLTVPVDTLHADKFYPPKDVQDNPFMWTEWVSVFLYSLLFVVLLVLVVYFVVCLKQNKPIISRIRLVKYVPPHQKAINDIEKLKADRAVVSENQKRYYTDLTMILRKYIAERFKFDAMEMTSTEIIDRLRAEGNGAIDEVVNLFRTADLVKFAKHSVLINENDANLMNALAFINDTKVEEKEPVRVVTVEEKKKAEVANKRILLKSAIALSVILALAALVAVIYKAYLLI